MNTRFVPLFVIPFTLLLTGGVSAQQSDEDELVIEEVIVTAQRREQAILDVPVAITAMTSEEIEARSVTSLLDAQYAVPSLTLSEFGPGQVRAQIRGIGTPGGSTGLSTVGFYLDEIPLSIGAAAGMDIRLLDMERLEVLRGPQPTLYGEGSMGGTIRYITASPDLSEFSGRVSGRWGSVTDGDSAYRASAVLNIPIVEDTLAIRLLGGYEETGGWIDQTATGNKDINGAEIKTFRGKLLWEPTDRMAFSLMWQHQEQDQDFQNFGDPDTRTTQSVFPRTE